MDDEEEQGPGIAVGAGSGGMPKVTKRKGQLRKKRADSDDEAKDGAPTPASAQSAGPSAVVKKEKKVVDKKKSALSFNSEEAGDGDEAFVSKKRTAGLSRHRPLHAARSPRQLPLPPAGLMVGQAHGDMRAQSRRPGVLELCGSPDAAR